MEDSYSKVLKKNTCWVPSKKGFKARYNSRSNLLKTTEFNLFSKFVKSVKDLKFTEIKELYSASDTDLIELLKICVHFNTPIGKLTTNHHWKNYQMDENQELLEEMSPSILIDDSDLSVYSDSNMLENISPSILIADSNMLENISPRILITDSPLYNNSTISFDDDLLLINGNFNKNFLNSSYLKYFIKKKFSTDSESSESKIRNSLQIKHYRYPGAPIEQTIIQNIYSDINFYNINCNTRYFLNVFHDNILFSKNQVKHFIIDEKLKIFKTNVRTFMGFGNGYCYAIRNYLIRNNERCRQIQIPYTLSKNYCDNEDENLKISLSRKSAMPDLPGFQCKNLSCQQENLLSGKHVVYCECITEAKSSVNSDEVTSIIVYKDQVELESLLNVKETEKNQSNLIRFKVFSGPNYIEDEVVYETSNFDNTHFSNESLNIEDISPKKEIEANGSTDELCENLECLKDSNNNLQECIYKLFEDCDPDDHGFVKKDILFEKLFLFHGLSLPEYMEALMKTSLQEAKNDLNFQELLGIVRSWLNYKPTDSSNNHLDFYQEDIMEKDTFSEVGRYDNHSSSFDEDLPFSKVETSLCHADPSIADEDDIEPHNEWRRSTLLPRKHPFNLVMSRDVTFNADFSFSPIKSVKTPCFFDKSIRTQQTIVNVPEGDVSSALLNYTVGSIETENNATIIDASEIQIELQEVRGSNEKLQSEKDQLKQMVERSEDSHQALIDRYQELEKSYEIAKKHLAENQHLRNELNDQKNQNAAEADKIALLNLQLSEAQAQNDSLLKTEEKLKEIIQSNVKELENRKRSEEQMAEELMQFCKEVSFLRMRLQSTEDTEETLRKEMTRLEETNEGLQSFIKVLQIEKLEIKEQLSELKCLNQSLITPTKICLEDEIKLTTDSDNSADERSANLGSMPINYTTPELQKPLDNIQTELLSVEPLPTIPADMALSTCSPWSLEKLDLQFDYSSECTTNYNERIQSRFLTSLRTIFFRLLMVVLVIWVLKNIVQVLEDYTDWKASSVFKVRFIGQRPF